MIASRMEWKRQRSIDVLAVSIKGPLVLLVAACLAGGTVSTARAQCGLLNDFSGQCVNLTWVVPDATALVGEVFEVELHAQSVNQLDQPFFGLDVVLSWDPTMIALVGNVDSCSASCTDVPSFTCPPAAGVPGGYNWLLSGFPNDVGLDGLNADCGPATFCSVFTGLPFNDGNVFYDAFKQIFCNGQQAVSPMAPSAPDTLLITTFQFQALAPGPVQVTMDVNAPCSTRQRICQRGDPGTIGDPCVVDSDCGLRACLGGGNEGLACSSDTDCPLGICLELCFACSGDFCCSADANCAQCFFARTRVLGGNNPGDDVIGTLAAPAQITISNCQPPSVVADGSRYLNIVPPAGTDPVAIFVEGVSPNVSCLSGYVGGNGTLQSSPSFRTPADWQSMMTDAFNDPADPTVHARGSDLIAGETYAVRMDCDPTNPGVTLSDAVQVSLWLFGDVDNNGDPNIADILRILDGFSGVFHTITCANDADCSAVAPHFTCEPSLAKCLWITRENVDIIGIGGCGSDRDVSIRDALSSLEAFQGLPNSCALFCP